MNGGRNYDKDRCSSENKIWLFAGTAEDPALPRRGDKATGADNQQERPRTIEESSETVRRTLMTSAMRQSELHGDMQSG